MVSDYDISFDSGITCLDKGDIASAARIFKECTKKKPDDYNAWLYLGIALSELEDYQDALSALKECTRIDASVPHAYTNMGIVYQKLNDSAEATRHFYKATKLDPEDITARLNLGLAFYKTRNRFMDAMLELKYVVEHDDSVSDAWAYLGFMFMDLQKRPYSMYCLQKAEVLGYKDPKVHKLILDMKFDNVIGTDPLDPSVKDTAFSPNMKDVVTQHKKEP